MMQLNLDRRVDAAYITIADTAVARTVKKDENRILDMDEHGDVIGIELLNISKGVDLTDLPFRDQLAPLLASYGIPQYA